MLQVAATFLNEIRILQLILLTYYISFDTVCNYYRTIFLYKL